MKIIKLISRAFESVLGSDFGSDMDVMSGDAKKILSNNEDRKKYIDAIEQLKASTDKDKEVTITLSNKQSITLVS